MIDALKSTSWVIMTGLAIILFAITAEYLSLRTDINFLLVKQHLIENSVWMPTFYIHVISGMVVILIGPFQFLKKFRQNYMGLHRSLGKIYAYAVLGFAAPSGLIMAFYAEGGLWSTVSFVIMSLLWFFTTIMAIITVMKKDILAHQRWMNRSYALSFAAVTLRLLVPLMSIYTTYSDEFIIVSTAWLSWIINLTFVEILIQYKLWVKKHPGKLKSR